MSKRVLITEPVPGDAASFLKQHGFEVAVGNRGELDSEEALSAALRKFDAALTMLSNPVSGEVLKSNPQLKIVANFAVGFNNIDTEVARDLGIRVANTPDVLSEATADIALGLLLSVARHFNAAESQLRSGGFNGWHPMGFLGTELHGKTAGILGMGRIGAAIARRLRGFGVNIYYHNRSRAEATVERELNARFFTDLTAMLEVCDFVFLSAPLTPQTHHIINKDRISRLKSDAILINTGRGPLVDEAALAAALLDGKLGGAGLDVFEFEPRVHPDLLRAPNTVLLPHIGSGTHETRQAMGMMAAQAIASVLNNSGTDSLKNLIV